MKTTTRTLTMAETEAYFRKGGTVTRHYRNMPASFETPEGVITRQNVNGLYNRDKLEAVRHGRFGATYRYFQG